MSSTGICKKKLADGHRHVRGVTVNLKILSLFVPPNVTAGTGGAASRRVQRTPVSVFLPALLPFDDRGRADDSESFTIPEERATASLAADDCSKTPSRPPPTTTTKVSKGTATVPVAIEGAHPL